MVLIVIMVEFLKTEKNMEIKNKNLKKYFNIFYLEKNLFFLFFCTNFFSIFTIFFLIKFFFFLYYNF